MEVRSKDPSRNKNWLRGKTSAGVLLLGLTAAAMAGCGERNLASDHAQENQKGNKANSGETSSEEQLSASPEEVENKNIVYQNVLKAGEEKLEMPYLDELRDEELLRETEHSLIDFASAQTDIMQALQEASGKDFYYETPDMPGIKLSNVDPEKATPEAGMVISYIPGYSGTSNAGGEFSEPAMLRFGSSMGNDSAVINFEFSSEKPVENFADVHNILNNPDQYGLQFRSLDTEYGESLYVNDSWLAAVNSAGNVSENYDWSSTESRVDDAQNTILSVREQLAHPNAERSWDELTHEERYVLGGKNFLLDTGQKMAKSELTEIRTFDDYGFGEGFSATILTPANNPQNYRKVESQKEGVRFCEENEPDLCVEPEETMLISMTYAPQESGGTIDASASVEHTLHGTIYQISTSASFPENSPLNSVTTPAEAAQALQEARDSDLTVTRLSAPSNNPPANYTFFRDQETGELSADHDDYATVGDFQTFEEHASEAVASLKYESAETYGIGKDESFRDIK